MYDLPPAPPPDPSEPSPEERAARQQRNLIMWGCIAGGGALVVLLLSCVLIGLLFIPAIVEQEMVSVPQPEQVIVVTATPDPLPTALPTSAATAVPPAATAAPALTPTITPAPTLPPADPDVVVPVPPPPEAPQPDASLTITGPVLIEADFEQPTTRWDQSSAQVLDGAYELRVETPNQDHYGLYMGGSEIRDFDLAVDAQQVAGVPDAAYGIRFRQSGPQDYLMFALSSKGFFRLVRVVDGDYQPIVPWTYNTRINTGDQSVNRLRVLAQGETIRAFINDQEVIQAEDDVQASGQLTLGLLTYDQGGLAVRFDNVSGQAEGTDMNETFDDPENISWSIGGARITNGEYELFTANGIQSWQHPLPVGASRVQSFIVNVDTTVVEGDADSAYGIVFGDGGEFDFYTLLLLPDGNVVLFHSDGGLLWATPAPAEAVATGIDARNAIELEVLDNALNITINGEEIAALDSTFPIEEGMVGMFISSGEQSRVQVRFDNFRLQELFENDPV
jgi:hypothetical protein